MTRTQKWIVSCFAGFAIANCVESVGIVIALVVMSSLIVSLILEE